MVERTRWHSERWALSARISAFGAVTQAVTTMTCQGFVQTESETVGRAVGRLVGTARLQLHRRARAGADLGTWWLRRLAMQVAPPAPAPAAASPACAHISAWRCCICNVTCSRSRRSCWSRGGSGSGALACRRRAGRMIRRHTSSRTRRCLCMARLCVSGGYSVNLQTWPLNSTPAYLSRRASWTRPFIRPAAMTGRTRSSSHPANGLHTPRHAGRPY